MKMKLTALTITFTLFLHLLDHGTSQPNGPGEQKTDWTPIRLVNGLSPNSGRVEVQISGIWGTICSNGFNRNDAQVVCRMLGYKGAAYQMYLTKEQRTTRKLIWLTYMGCKGNESSILKCRHSLLKNYYCDHSKDVGVLCEHNPVGPLGSLPIRLAGGVSPNCGRVEVWLGGRWGTICNHGFDTRDASVICRMLGYRGTSFDMYLEPSRRINTGPIWMDHLTCDGTESNVLDCYKGVLGFPHCIHREDVAVLCKNDTNPLPVRLANGTAENSGRVEIQVGDEWGTICSKGFDKHAATVICRMLGYNGSSIQINLEKTQRISTGPIWMSHLQCNGTETSVEQCFNQILGHPRCHHGEDVGLLCQDAGEEMARVRLAGGSANNSGRVEVNIAGKWGTVCDDRFNLADARVICRQLGYSGSAFQIYLTAAQKIFTGPIWLTDLACKGNESNVMECFHGALGVSRCKHTEDVGILCQDNKITANTDICLVDGISPNTGRVEIKIDGTWGTICDNGFDKPDAQVVCGMLGFKGFGLLMQLSPGQSRQSGKIWMSNLACVGTEETVEDCHQWPLGPNICTHKDDVGLACHDFPKEEIPVRLVDGVSSGTGRVEIQIGGVWGTVCDDLFDNRDATVICRMLGYNGTSLNLGHVGGRGTGRIWLSNLACKGTESCIMDCYRGPIGRNRCTHKEDVSVFCQNSSPEPLEVRLVDGKTPNSGRVEIKIHDTWGTICRDQFDVRDAEVVCRMLGYTGPAFPIASEKPKNSSIPIWMSDVVCSGKETSLQDCHHTNLGMTTCTHEEDVGVMCLKDSVEVKLTGGSTERNGAVEIKLDGTWGLIQTGDFTMDDCRVICRMINSTDTSNYLLPSVKSEGKTLWFGALRCKGTESSLVECREPIMAANTCGPNGAVAIACEDPLS